MSGTAAKKQNNKLKKKTFRIYNLKRVSDYYHMMNL